MNTNPETCPKCGAEKTSGGLNDAESVARELHDRLAASQLELRRYKKAAEIEARHRVIAGLGALMHLSPSQQIKAEAETLLSMLTEADEERLKEARDEG